MRTYMTLKQVEPIVLKIECNRCKRYVKEVRVPFIDSDLQLCPRCYRLYKKTLDKRLKI